MHAAFLQQGHLPRDCCIHADRREVRQLTRGLRIDVQRWGSFGENESGMQAGGRFQGG